MTQGLDLVLYASIGINAILLMVFFRLQSFWQDPGRKNFFIQQINASFNRIRNASLVYGANSSRYAPISFVGEGEALYSDPGNKQTLPLQYDPKNLYHGPRGIPVRFAFQGVPYNVDPLKQTNDDIEPVLAAQATAAFIETEVERKFANENPLKQMKNMMLILGAVVVLGFIVMGALLYGVQGSVTDFSKVAVGALNTYKPLLDKALRDLPSYAVPGVTNVGNSPNNPLTVLTGGK